MQAEQGREPKDADGHGRPGAQGGYRVAVCLATYRRPRYLEAALGSLERLRFHKSGQPQITVVVIDNDEGGDACRYCRRLADGYRWPLLCAVEPRRGTSYARNAAVRLSGDADLLAFIDDDEVADPWWLDELVFALDRHQADVVTGPVIPVLPETTATWIRRGRFFDRGRQASGAVLSSARTGNALLRRAALEGFPEPFAVQFALSGGEDSHFFRHAHLRGFRIVWCDEALVYETVPETRLNVSWIVSRAYRNAINYNRSVIRLHAPLAVVPQRLVKGWLRLLIGVGRFLFLSVAGKHNTVQGLCDIASSLGTFSAFLGIRKDGYRIVHGK